MQRSWLVPLACIAAVGGLGMPALADPVTITFDEVPLGTDVNGLAIGNVTFGFTGGTAAVSLNGPGNTPLIDDPNIEGPSDGTLTMAFTQPVFSLAYSFALSVAGTNFPDGSTAQYFDTGGMLIGTASADAVVPMGGLFPEGRVQILSGVGVSSVVVTFTAFDSGAGRFAVDNVTYDTAVIPLPGAGALAAVGLAAITRRRVRSLA